MSNETCTCENCTCKGCTEGNLCPCCAAGNCPCEENCPNCDCC